MTNKEKIILTDVDGCLLNWNQEFDVFMETQGFPALPGTESHYDISVRHAVSHHQAMEFVNQFNESRKIESLEPHKDSVEYVLKLAAQGFRFIVVTAISDHPDAVDRRTTNLKAVFGDIFDEIICIPTGASKYHVLSRWADTDYFWIEDHMRQAEAGHEHGLKTVLIEQPHNTHYTTDLFPRVSGDNPWQQIYNMVCDDYGLPQ